LPSAKTAPDLPWMFANLHCVDFRTDSQPLERLIWGITGQKPAQLANVLLSNKPPTMQETAPRLIAGGDEEAGSDNVISGTRLFPRLTQQPDTDSATQLNILRRRVEEFWVDGVLEHSLYNEVLISLDKRKIDKAVDAPWKYTVEVSDSMNSGPLDDRDVSAIYDVTGLLLILGEPGSGKTTTLLDLARTLLERAKDDIKERVPIVLNLSSWKKKQPLAEWISNELSEKYRVPRKIGHFWLQRGYLLPLLDGLDEVETVVQPDCVTAINKFIEESNASGLVVCCRLNEYRWLPTRLKLNGAICIEPLGSDEVSKYLAAGGSKLAGLREAIDADPVVHELAQTPLMLSIMSLAFQGVGSDELAAQKGVSPAERREQIFDLYVEHMFQRKGMASPVFPKEKTVGWLSWLAGKMREHSQSEFLVEGLQPSWLGTRAKWVAYGTVVTLIFGLMGWLYVGLNGRRLINGLVLAFCFIIIGGSLNHITLVETISWKWNRFWVGTIGGLIVGLIGGLIVGLIGGLDYGLLFAFASLAGVALINGLTERVKVGKTSPNQGIKLSMNNFLVVFFVSLSGGLLFGPIFGLIFGLIGRDAGFGWGVGLSLGPYLGLMVGLNRGGSAVIKHYVLRLILWLSGCTPFKFIKFLDQCAKLIFLKKVGGGYIFVHRMLLDYFADLTPASKKAEDGKTGAVRSFVFR
jgi:hypothetical protein